jgi:leader peptidase (prepilin peptidase)/N-methyltransferase
LIEATLALLFGLLIGSFLNVCIYRWPRDLSVVRPRSHCPSCEKTIAWYDNIPLLSYALLGGRCRHCRARISPRYPVVELLTGTLFFVFVYTLGPRLAALKMCVFSAILVGLVFAIFVPVPDITAQALLWLAGLDLTPGIPQSLAEAAFGAILPALFLWGGGWVYYKVRHREGLGFGDVKLIAMVGAFLGLRGALLTLILGSLAGSLLGYGYIKLTGKDASTYELPFGSFLGAAALAVALIGPTLPGWQ